MNKLGILVSCSALALVDACASTPQAQPQAVNVNSEEWKPPTDMELTWEDRGKHRYPETPLPSETPDQENQRYKDSLTKISETMSTERLQLIMAGDTYGYNSKYYKDLLHQFCQVDMLLDSRQDHHYKDYCKK
jgi:hypothetical protein